MTQSDRVLILEGARNFRDIGGYPTRSGKRIKWGLLFRSDYLTHLTEEDCARVHEIGIRTVFDLRSNMERERYPSRWHPQSSAETLFWEDTREAEKLGERLQRYRHENETTDNQLHGFLCYHYRHYLEIQAEKFSGILAQLVKEESAPALIHCTAGKDRTGIMIALILYLLEVDEDLIMQDYLLTNEHVKGPDDKERFRLLLRQFGFEEITDGIMNAMIYAHQEYLQAAFDGMREDFGSVEQYAEKRLGFDAEMTARLQSIYLE